MSLPDESQPLLADVNGSPRVQVAQQTPEHRQRSSSIVSRWKDKVSKSLFSSNQNRYRRATEIYYSVFAQYQNPRDIFTVPPKTIALMQQEDFQQKVQSVCDAFLLNIHPQRISQGSSGSYFMRNQDGVIVGVFKPKDEEPYGPLSPKWTKWVHRNLFPCFFGRSCLIPNSGYISEAAASKLDRLLGTNIVPFTDVVAFYSPSFYYRLYDRLFMSRLPPKIGSFQLFLQGYEQADVFLRQYPLPDCKSSDHCQKHLSEILEEDDQPKFRWTPSVLQQFREEIEKLVILDYIMRNTDRGLDNWMIHLSWTTDENGTKTPRLKIGAIDSGLAFPWKHPDEWRSYPFGWLFLPMLLIGQPFSEATRNQFLPVLTSTDWWEDASIEMRQLFSKDSEFKERMWKKQWALVKGQAFNVVQSLRNPHEGPLDLARRIRVMIWDDEVKTPTHLPSVSSLNKDSAPMSLSMILPSSSTIPEEGDDDGDSRLQVSRSLDTSIAHEFHDVSRSVDGLLASPASPADKRSRPIPRRILTSSGSPERKRNGGSSLALEAKYYSMQGDGTSARWNGLINDGNEPETPPWYSKVNNLFKHDYALSNESQNSPNLRRHQDADESMDLGIAHVDRGGRPVMKKVIIERLQTVESKPPVFTWC